MEEVTDLDKEVAWQLVQLSEGDSTTTTTTTTTTLMATTSSSGSCNDSTLFTTLDKVVDNISGRYKFKGNINNNKRKTVDIDVGKNNAQVFGNSIKEDISEIISLPLDLIVAGVLEDDDEDDNEFGNSNNRKKKIKYRSIVELYSVTERVDDYCYADDQ